VLSGAAILGCPRLSGAPEEGHLLPVVPVIDHFCQPAADVV
jgi:hypothetical protein